MSNTYSAVAAPTTATTISVSTYGSKVTDALDYLAVSKPNARAFNSAVQSIPNTTSTVLTFDSESYDKGSGSHSTSVNTGRLTVPTSCGGVYYIGARVSWASNATGYRSLSLRVNGTTTIATISYPVRTDGFSDLCLSTNYSLAAGDYVEALVSQTSGGSLNTGTDHAIWWNWVST